MADVLFIVYFQIYYSVGSTEDLLSIADYALTAINLGIHGMTSAATASTGGMTQSFRIPDQPSDNPDVT